MGVIKKRLELNTKGQNIFVWLAQLLLLLGLLLPQGAVAQQYNFRHYTIRDGLASMAVYDIRQDDMGYIWFATTEGVARFDGYRFEVFTTDDGLPGNEVLGLWESNHGSMWMLCFRKGLAKFENDTILPLALNLPLEDLPIKSFVPDTLGNFWLTTAKSDVLLYRDSVISRIGIDRISSSRYTEPVLMPDNKGNVWIGGDNSLMLWRDNVMLNLPVYFEKSLVSPLKPLISSTGNVYLLSASNVWQYQGDTMVAVAAFSDDVIILRASAGRDGSLLLATTVGAIRLSAAANGTMLSEWFMKGNSISQIIEDTEGNYWLSTLNDGVYMLTQSSRQVVNLNENNGLFKSLPGSITVAHNELVISSQYGDIYALTKRNGYAFEFLKNDRLCGNFGNCVTMPDSSLWCSTSVGFINLENRTISNMKPILFVEQVLTGLTSITFADSINCINVGTVKESAIMHDSLIVAASNIGLFLINTNPQTNFLTHRYITDRTTALALDEQNDVLWVATVKGVYYWPLERPFELFQDTLLDELNDAQINYMLMASENSLVIGTAGMGLFIQKDAKLYHFNTQNGLASNIVKHLLQTPYGLLVATSKGVCVVNENTNGGYSIFPAQFNDGLASEDVKQTLLCNGSLYVLTTKGLSIVKPEALQVDSTKPVTHISKISIAGNDTTIHTSYTLPHYSNSLMIEYVGLLYKADGKLIYRYQMEGIDTGWVQTSFTNVQYPALAPGSYTFRVDSRSPQGGWSGKPVEIQMTILPPFWQTWWFKLLMGALALGLVTGISYSVIRYYRNQSYIAQRMVELEGNALRANMNPHFVFNALNAIHDFIANSDEKSAHLYLGKFAKLIRRILDQSRKDFISLEEELDTLKLYLELENMRFENKFRFEIKIEDGIQPYDIELPPMLIQPYLENAVRHGLMNLGRPGMIKVAFSRFDNYLECTITDNGVGRAKAMEVSSKRLKSHRSAGMEITQKRVDLLYEAGKEKNRAGVEIIDLMDDMGHPSGTEVSILLPLKVL